MKATIPLAAALFAAILIPFPASALIVALDSVASSFIKDPTVKTNDPYTHEMSIQNYQAGYNSTEDFLTRNWFIFELPTLMPGEEIKSATLALYMPLFTGTPAGDAGFGYDSDGASEDFAVYSVSDAAAPAISPIKILDDDTFPDDGPFFDTWFPTLPDGIELGTATVTELDEGSDVLVEFGPDGIMKLMEGLGGDFLMGGSVTTIDHEAIDDIGEGIFHHTHPYGFGAPPADETAAPVLFLDIGMIPEPSVVALLLPMFAMLALCRRRVE